MIIGLSGYAGTHKEAVADLLATSLPSLPLSTRSVTDLVERLASSSPLWDGRRTPAARALMWEASAQLRATFGEDVLIRDALRYPLPPHLVVIGIRLDVEAAALRAAGGTLVCLSRPGALPHDALESSLPTPDVEVDSSSPLSATRAIARLLGVML